VYFPNIRLARPDERWVMGADQHDKPAARRKPDATRLAFQILAQPDDSTCGPTCLHAVYRYLGDESCGLDEIVSGVPALEAGGTLAVFLGCDALKRGYRATIITYNLHVFDPTWFSSPDVDIASRLVDQLQAKPDPMLRVASDGYLEFLRRGGGIRFEDLTAGLIRKHLTKGWPILTGLSATYLYRSPREYGPKNDEDDVRGFPVGHFVVLCGYDRRSREVIVADPLHPNPFSESHLYTVKIDRVINAILLGVITYDANLLILKPPRDK
jgi:hypothetical protein